MNKKNKHIGSNFDDFLAQEGLLEQAEAIAIKRVVAYQIEQAMVKEHLTKTMLAKKMHTSRSSIDRLFDMKNVSVTLATLYKAAYALNLKLKVQLV